MTDDPGREPIDTPIWGAQPRWAAEKMNRHSTTTLVERVARALHESMYRNDMYVNQFEIADYPPYDWDQLDTDMQAEYRVMARAALDELAPQLTAHAFGSYAARRDHAFREMRSLLDATIDSLATAHGELARYRDAFGELPPQRHDSNDDAR